MQTEGINGAYFFKIKALMFEEITVNGKGYRDMINSCFVLELEDVNVGDLWLQQVGAICHTANATINLLLSRVAGL